MDAAAAGSLKCEVKKKFVDLGVSPWLVEQCKQVGIATPTAVQINCIPAVLTGSDVIGCAKTGTGKTLAFAIPILQKLAEDPFGIFALILTPTRELAFQIADQFRVLGKPIGAKDCVIVGGRDMVEQGKEMVRRPHILISTPGRLADHIESGHQVPLGQIKFLVLDEADRLLDGQYGDQLKTIFSALPKQRQTLLFSATITDALTELKQLALRKPHSWEDPAVSETVIVANLEQSYVLCPVEVKDAFLVYAVKLYVEKHPENSVLIFTHSCHECQALVEMFRGLGFRCGGLHSLIPQSERLASLSRFRSNRIRILICTDVASRGLDIQAVSLVVNHNVPQLPKNYVHRVGRAARAGRSGSSLTFVTQYDIGLLQAVEKVTHTKMKELKLSDKKVAQCVTEVLVAKREAEAKLERNKFGEQRDINKRKQMAMAGLDQDEIDRMMERRKERRLKS